MAVVNRRVQGSRFRVPGCDQWLLAARHWLLATNRKLPASIKKQEASGQHVKP